MRVSFVLWTRSPLKMTSGCHSPNDPQAEYVPCAGSRKQVDAEEPSWGSPAQLDVPPSSIRLITKAGPSASGVPQTAGG